jgi:hypothetical protein
MTVFASFVLPPLLGFAFKCATRIALWTISPDGVLVAFTLTVVLGLGYCLRQLLDHNWLSVTAEERSARMLAYLTIDHQVLTSEMAEKELELLLAERDRFHRGMSNFKCEMVAELRARYYKPQRSDAMERTMADYIRRWARAKGHRVTHCSDDMPEVIEMAFLPSEASIRASELRNSHAAQELHWRQRRADNSHSLSWLRARWSDWRLWLKSPRKPAQN